MAWTGIASDLTLTDVTGPSYPIPVQAAPAPKPATPVASASRPTSPVRAPAKPDQWPLSRFIVAGCVLGLLVAGTLKWHALQADTSTSDIATQTSGEVSRAPAKARPVVKVHPAADAASEPASPSSDTATATALQHSRVHEHPRASKRSEPAGSGVPNAAADAGANAAGDVSKDMTLEHFRDLSGKI